MGCFVDFFYSFFFDFYIKRKWVYYFPNMYVCPEGISLRLFFFLYKVLLETVGWHNKFVITLSAYIIIANSISSFCIIINQLKVEICFCLVFKFESTRKLQTTIVNYYLNSKIIEIFHTHNFYIFSH